jgi:hypothetical protein
MTIQDEQEQIIKECGADNLDNPLFEMTFMDHREVIHARDIDAAWLYALKTGYCLVDVVPV